MKKLILLIPAVFLIFQSCKDDDTDNMTKTKTELLTVSVWKISGATINPALDTGGGNFITDFTVLLEDCDKDDLVKYELNFTGVEDEGATKCDTADLQTTSFTWKFASNQTKLIQDTDTTDMPELSATTLKRVFEIDGEDLGDSGTLYRVTGIWTH